uniref:Uncharacterized protein n=1 Tax=Timema bartmani TaxID=61472 RepID=A0A7R9FBM9_9NEOP|nr:unnamed protein product [Timema bartmani]
MLVVGLELTNRTLELTNRTLELTNGTLELASKILELAKRGAVVSLKTTAPQAALFVNTNEMGQEEQLRRSRQVDQTVKTILEWLQGRYTRRATEGEYTRRAMEGEYKRRAMEDENKRRAMEGENKRRAMEDAVYWDVHVVPEVLWEAHDRV